MKHSIQIQATAKKKREANFTGRRRKQRSRRNASVRSKTPGQRTLDLKNLFSSASRNALGRNAIVARKFHRSKRSRFPRWAQSFTSIALWQCFRLSGSVASLDIFALSGRSSFPARPTESPPRSPFAGSWRTRKPVVERRPGTRLARNRQPLRLPRATRRQPAPSAGFHPGRRIGHDQRIFVIRRLAIGAHHRSTTPRHRSQP